MIRKGVLLMGVLVPLAFSQQKAPDPAIIKSQAASGSLPLRGEASVGGQVSVEAVLMPPSTTRGLFGRAVSDRYAAVQVVISNHSHEASMVLESIFIDYSKWLLSGSSGDAQKKGRVDDYPYESQNDPNQIASAEYRLPRGQLLDAQPRTGRNITIRLLEAAGTLASGYGFAFTELGIAKGIASYNGNFLPAARYLWPDQTIDQLNRISDLGFRVNTVVPREASVIMVAFFALDRFLTPGLKKIYMKSPAIFFVPQAALFDPKVKRDLQKIFKTADPDLYRQITAQVKTDLQSPSPQGNDFLNKLSLNRVRVLVSGSMTVDQETISAVIEEVTFDSSANTVEFWNTPGKKSGVIRGRYLSGGKVIIENADSLGITNLVTVSAGATERGLPFALELTKPIPIGEALEFRVDKESKSGENTTGIAYKYVVREKKP